MSLKERPSITTPPVYLERGGPMPPPPMRVVSASVTSQGHHVQPPYVKIQPPLSPPKVNGSKFASGDQSPFLDPVSIPSQSSSGSPTPLKIPSRPLTPTSGIATPRSPRLGSSLPPSPPPPRRSVEIRREREPKPAPPPPASRLEKPPVPNLKPTSAPEPRGHPLTKRGDIVEETSPFSSPPNSPGAENEMPPELPTRPSQKPQSAAPGRPKPSFASFEPPLNHLSIVTKRLGNDQDVNGVTRGHISPQLTGESRPALPARPQPHELTSQHLPMHVVKAPPRPPRSVPQSSLQKPATPSPPPPPPNTGGRAVSNPTQLQQLPPPSKSHGRSKTADQWSGRSSPEGRAPQTPISSTQKPFPTPVVYEGVNPKNEPPIQITAFPDSSSTNRRPPIIKKGAHDINPKYDPRIFDVCGQYVCTSGHLTRVWSLVDGEQIVSLAHTEGVKATAVAFKPAADPDHEGAKLWIGTNVGEIMEVEVATHRILNSRAGVHGRSEVAKIYRHFNELWTVDEGGNLFVWAPGDDGSPSLDGNPAQIYKLPKGETFSMLVGDELWQATGKTIRVFAPTADNHRPFQVLVRAITADGAGDITAGTTIRSQPGKVFFGHADGKISIFSTKDYCCQTIFSISTWKVNALAGVGQYLWTGYNTGKICVYDVGQTPWAVLKEWQAHDNALFKMKVDPASTYQLEQLQVVSLGADSRIKVWDGLLQDDWLEDEMKSKDTKYSDFNEISALIFTWNAGASTPHSLRYSDGDASFFQQLLQSSGSPDILVFGFQELVDLEDKTATAKRLLKSKKKEGSEQERMSHQYRDWRDFLLKTLDDYMPANDLYHLLHTAPMVGLFTCIFVKSSLRDRIRNLSGAEVKRGMGGVYGNKGAVTVRFQVDDTSLCFVNCHLAAGQTQASSRNSDAAAILEASIFPVDRDLETRIDRFTGGGDGSMILDHELCILNGDLNYRIDTMSRDTVVKAVQQNNLAKLLERDQLLVARRRNPALRLRAFDELPITFAPTYKYDVGTDIYDTSEKRRSPAWCDRILFRGRGRVQQLDYKRHEIRVSDHRPVTGNFHLWVKKIKPKERAMAWLECQKGFEDVRQRELGDEK